jgi:hypothetical protein
LDDFVIEGEFRWTTTQEQPEYTNWDVAEGNPSDSNAGEDCGEIRDNGLWNDVACETAQRSFVCEFE